MAIDVALQFNTTATATTDPYDKVLANPCARARPESRTYRETGSRTKIAELNTNESEGLP